MSGFKPRPLGVGNDCAATATLQFSFKLKLIVLFIRNLYPNGLIKLAQRLERENKCIKRLK